jgi:hypothetical protein
MQQPTRENRLSTASSLMCLQMQPFVTPISGALEDGTAVHVGISNHHVAAAVAKHSLARKFFDAPEYLRVNQPWHSVSAPEDLAASRVDDTWNHVIHSGMAFPEHRFARAHAPVQGEYLFTMGFADEKSYYAASFETLFTVGTPYLTQQFDPTLEPVDGDRTVKSEHFDPEVHFALHWHPEETKAADGRKHAAPNDLHGFSGSFVWNTRIAEFEAAGEEWSPGVARLTGIAWGWDTSDRPAIQALAALGVGGHVSSPAREVLACTSRPSSC